MTRTRLLPTVARIVLVCLLLPSSAGCDLELAGEVATISGSYVGDVVTVLVTGYLYDLLGIEGDATADAHSNEDGHSHDAEPLHEHEH